MMISDSPPLIQRISRPRRCERVVGLSALMAVLGTGSVAASRAPIPVEWLRQKPPDSGVIDLGAAAQSAETAASLCASKGYAVSVVVVDTNGKTVAQISALGASPLWDKFAFRKAASALGGGVGLPARRVHSRLAEGDAAALVLRDFFRVLGAIAVAGAPTTEANLRCTEAGVSSFQWADWKRQDVEFFLFNPMREFGNRQ